MAESVFFSVLIPVYNVAPYLRECLDSVLKQGFDKLELVVIDDGSTDGSGAICDEYAANDTRVRVFHKENGGLMSARRAALARARGDYYLFVDSDDRLLPGAFETLAEAIKESGADCLVYGITREMPQGIIHVVNNASLCGRVITDRHEIVSLVLNDNTYNSLCRKCVRASCFDGRDFSPYFSVSRGEDLIQTTEILENARSFFFLPQELYYYRLNRDSITRSICYDGYRADFTLESFQLDWLRRLSLFDGADFDRWHDHLLDELVIELKQICRRCSDRANMVNALDSIRADGFYRGFLAPGYRTGGGGLRRSANRLVIRLLEKRRYDALIFFCTRIYRAR
jgi:Glycosyltransferases involved in cell wall biogenesis